MVTGRGNPTGSHNFATIPISPHFVNVCSSKILNCFTQIKSFLLSQLYPSTSTSYILDFDQLPDSLSSALLPRIYRIEVFCSPLRLYPLSSTYVSFSNIDAPDKYLSLFKSARNFKQYAVAKSGLEIRPKISRSH